VASGKETSAKGAGKGFSTMVVLVARSNWKKCDTSIFDYVALQPVILTGKTTANFPT